MCIYIHQRPHLSYRFLFFREKLMVTTPPTSPRGPIKEEAQLAAISELYSQREMILFLPIGSPTVIGQGKNQKHVSHSTSCNSSTSAWFEFYRRVVNIINCRGVINSNNSVGLREASLPIQSPQGLSTQVQPMEIKIKIKRLA